AGRGQPHPGRDPRSVSRARRGARARRRLSALSHRPLRPCAPDPARGACRRRGSAERLPPALPLRHARAAAGRPRLSRPDRRPGSGRARQRPSLLDGRSRSSPRRARRAPGCRRGGRDPRRHRGAALSPGVVMIGLPIKRKEDFRLLTGRGKYAADVRLPGLLHAAVLRSPHPHARIAAIRAGAARALPGVAAVITADDLGAVGRIPVRLGQRSGAGPIACLQPPLATGLVRYVGEPVAFVIASSRYLAEDALELVEIDWEPLPIVADVNRARAADAPVLHPAAGSNVIERLTVRAGNPDEALAGAD